MLSDRFFKLFDYQQKFALLFGGTPYRWDLKNRKLTVTKWSYYVYAGNIASLAAYACFLFIQLIRYRLMEKTTDFYYYFLYALTVCAVFDLTAAYPFLRRPEHSAAFVSEFYNFLNEIASDFMSTFDPNTSCMNMAFDGMVVMMLLGYPFCGLVISCHFLLFPHWPCYLSSLVPPEELTLPLYLSAGAIYFYGLQMIWAVLCLCCMVGFPYAFYLWHISGEYFCFPDGLKRAPQGGYAKKVWSRQRTTASFRSFEYLRFRYRQLEVLHWNFMECFSSVIIPIQASLTSLGVFCNFSLVKHRHILTLTNTCILLIWSVGGTCVTLTALTFCGAMYIRSVKMLRTMRMKDWGSKEKNVEMKKFVQSCRPISYGYGRMYVIRKISSFKYIKHLTRGTFRALLTTKK